MYLDENTLKEIIIAAIQFRGEGISIGVAIKEAAEAVVSIDKDFLHLAMTNHSTLGLAIKKLVEI